MGSTGIGPHRQRLLGNGERNGSGFGAEGLQQARPRGPAPRSSFGRSPGGAGGLAYATTGLSPAGGSTVLPLHRETPAAELL